MKFTGADELRAKLATLSNAVGKKIVRRQITKATRLVKNAAIANVVTKSGLLAFSIGEKIKTGRGGVYGVIGPRKGFRREGDKDIPQRLGWLQDIVIRSVRPRFEDPAKYAHLVEKGSKPHAITIRLFHGNVVVQHPGTAPQPFMGPAFESQKSSINQLLGPGLGAEIEKEAAK